MGIPLKPARNPRWDARPAEIDVTDVGASDAVASHGSYDSYDGSGAYEDEVAEILSEIQSVTAVAQLESRVDSIEHDIFRIVSGHEEDAGRLTSELTIMKARIEDALGAVSATVTELRAAGTAVTAPPALEAMAPAINEEALRDKIRSARDDAIEAARTEAAARLKQIRSEVETAISTARAEFQSSFTGLLQGLEGGLQGAREQAVREIAKLRERVDPEIQAIREDMTDESTTLRRDLVATEETFSGALRSFASRIEGLQSQIAESGARQAAERATYNAGIEGLAQRIDALEDRMAEGLARLSEGILRVAENVGSATTLQRRIAALEAQMLDLSSS